MATTAQEAMKAVVNYVGSDLKDRGFKKRRHTFNRSTDDGVIHVLSFQMGSYQPLSPSLSETGREAYMRATLNPMLYGSFTVNLGVFVPELDAVTRNIGFARKRPSTFVLEYDCHIRQRLGHLIDGNDHWWRLDLPVAEIGLTMSELLRVHAFPFLDRSATRQGIVARWVEEPSFDSFPGPSRLQVAIIAASLDDHDLARRLLQDDYLQTIQEEPDRPMSIKYVEDVAAQLGYEPLRPPD